MPPLYRRYPALEHGLPRVRLGRSSATPARRMEALERALGADAPRSGLWLKDDGGFAAPYGGNKPRKLEFVLAEARARGRRAILTIGGTGTNHGLATAIYARQHGLEPILVLVDQPDTPQARTQLERLRASGAILRFTHGPIRTLLALPWLLLRHAAYFLWVGGSSPLGTVGFVEAGLELGEQVARGELPEPSHLVCALSSGGTAAGLLVGLRLAGLRTRVHAVAVTEHRYIGARLVARLARRTARLLVKRGADLPAAARRYHASDLDVEHGFVGGEYGALLPAAEDAVALCAAAESLRLDSVYTGKAMAALIAHARARGFGDGPVLYWHTYDTSEAEAAT
jgi:D-cysteine desulfhydrase